MYSAGRNGRGSSLYPGPHQGIAKVFGKNMLLLKKPQERFNSGNFAMSGCAFQASDIKGCKIALNGKGLITFTWVTWSVADHSARSYRYPRLVCMVKLRAGMYT